MTHVPRGVVRIRARGPVGDRGPSPALLLVSGWMRVKMEMGERADRARTDASLAAEREKTDSELRAARLRADEKTRDAGDDGCGLLVERMRSDSSVASRDKFLAMVTHDLRGPLGAISVHATCLIEDISGDEGGWKIRQSAEAIKRW
jgi:signal transduction histidine kinase